MRKSCEELRSVQIEDDEMEMSDDDRDSRCSSTKKTRLDSDSLKEENDSLRCQIDAMRNEMYMNRSELRQDSDFREKQIKVLQETIRNMQTQLLQTKMREQKDAKSIELLERELKEARVRTLLLQTKIKETNAKQKETKISNAKENVEKDISDATTFAQKSPQHKLNIENEEEFLQNESELNKSNENSKEPIEKNAIIVDNKLGDNAKDKGDNKVKNWNVNENDEKHILMLSDTKDTTDIKIISDLKTEIKSLELFEARIIVLATAFLVVQPMGASSKSICNYINNILKNHELKASSLDCVLSKYEELFKAVDSTQCYDADVGTKWLFCGFV